MPTTTERLICAFLRGERASEPLRNGPSDVSRFIAAARYHGVLPLLEESLDGVAGGPEWPIALVDACRRDAASHRILEFARRAELPRVLDAFADAGIKPLVLKGGAIGETHYSNAALRPTSDIDLLIPGSRKASAGQVLRRLGYTVSGGTSGDLVAYQATWGRKDSLEIAHVLDVHWRISNSQILAGLLDYDELEPAAVRLPRLGANAYGLAAPYALLFACMHRAGHRNAPYYVDGVAYAGGDRLIWLYDIHLILSRMSGSEIKEFLELATAKRLKTICLEALDRSAECFNTAIPAEIREVLSRTGPPEPAARYLGGGRIRQFVGDLIAIETWRQRRLFLKEVVFPPAAYMHDKYARATIQYLPVLYARRAIQGFWRVAVPGSGSGQHRKGRAPEDCAR